ncbi:SWIM zinc finger family protein [Frankia sp. AgKG'84/4]|uniref:SWIM zinc finger family protein n=1 Tax=Frankia sp. AgKG'84/4 TaxID=573490 RepID=UPI00200E2108|nr:hypothetical protein [Frankia sp. AgKG'84/4]MCL9793841.1 hypothetical protein [Frankia sp. AgKG'84/4]
MSDLSASSVWSRRFLTLIDDLGMAAPLRDGRRLARTGAVLGLRRSANLVVARVRHPDEEIHKARLAVRTFSGGDWARIERALAARAGYAASLLAGSVPAEIDRVFAALGLSPLPTGADDLAMDCSCTDWQRPCAHLAAACHELARHLDHDPFEVLALRGRERDVLLDGLRTYRSVPVPVPDGAAGATSEDTEAAPDAVLPASPEAFWSSPADPGPGAAAEADASASVGRPNTSDSVSQPNNAGVGHEMNKSGDGGDGVLDRCGPLILDAAGDVRALLRPAYAAFATRER